MTAPRGFWLEAGVPVSEHRCPLPAFRGPSYRSDVSEAYDVGYSRGYINAPRAEHFEHHDSAGWLLGWADGMVDWDGVRGFRDT